MEPESSLDLFNEDYKIITKVEIKEEPLWAHGKPVEVKPEEIQDPLVSGADFRNEMKNDKEDMSKKRKRTENYTSEETLKLLGCVKKYQHIVENKKIDAATCKQKDEAWEKICQEYNSSNTNIKTAKMLRCKFEALKKKARKYAAAQSQSRPQTCGGFSAEIKSYTILDKVQEIIQMSVDSLLNVPDTDKIPEAVRVETENNIDKNCVAVEAVPERFGVGVPLISLESLCKCSCMSELNAEDVGSPFTAKCSTQCHLSKGTTPASTSGEKLSALPTLQQELLREQFAQRERREQELHEYNIQIKKTKLQIKKAELMNQRLDIQIKRKTLKKLDDSQ